MKYLFFAVLSIFVLSSCNSSNDNDKDETVQELVLEGKIESNGSDLTGIKITAHVGPVVGNRLLVDSAIIVNDRFKLTLPAIPDKYLISGLNSALLDNSALSDPVKTIDLDIHIYYYPSPSRVELKGRDSKGNECRVSFRYFDRATTLKATRTQDSDYDITIEKSSINKGWNKLYFYGDDTGNKYKITVSTTKPDNIDFKWEM